MIKKLLELAELAESGYADISTLRTDKIRLGLYTHNFGHSYHDSEEELLQAIEDSILKLRPKKEDITNA